MLRMAQERRLVETAILALRWESPSTGHEAFTHFPSVKIPASLLFSVDGTGKGFKSPRYRSILHAELCVSAPLQHCLWLNSIHSNEKARIDTSQGFRIFFAYSMSLLRKDEPCSPLFEHVDLPKSLDVR